MITAADVAAYILDRQGEMTAMKLQKLVYYSYAWHLVWEGEKLFEDRIEAWANGPVVPSLYKLHRGQFKVSSLPEGIPDHVVGDPSALTSVDAVLNHYGDKSPFYLSELTHSEDPWKAARQGLNPGERGSVPISDAKIVEYHEGFVLPDDA
ncbi:MAG: DUF4065 domain-containing protein [Deltaproteobacteria bacterium]|nr:DUF4065 domain-containing protein [Deltaproteobacteria bacterium]